MNKKKLYVGNLVYRIDTPDLRRLFTSYGEIKDVVVIKQKLTGKSRGFGFVTFAEETQALAAAIDMQGRNVGGRPLRIKFADNAHRHKDPALSTVNTMNNDLITDDLPVMEVPSQNFFVLIDENAKITEHVHLLRQEKQAAVQTISQELINGSQNKNNENYPWAITIGLEDTELPSNLKHYLYLLLSLMQVVDETDEWQPLRDEVENRVLFNLKHETQYFV
jgi:RNA recognition motif-containing protein